ncbi:MAG: hypothetical protein LBD60_04560 [Puniceicoccales bacterium]|nr:hypothetical protein [Puniceicoccales bacterium]
MYRLFLALFLLCSDANAGIGKWREWKKLRVKNDIKDVNAVLSSLASGNIWTMKRSRANPSKAAELTIKRHFFK